MHQPQRLQPGDCGGIEVCPPLEIGQVGRDPDDAITDQGLEALLGYQLEVAEEHGEDLDRGEDASLVQEADADQDPAVGGLRGGEGEAAEVILDGGVAKGTAEEALDLGDGGAGEAGGGGGAGSPEEALLLAEGDHGRVLALGLVVEEDVDAALPNGRDDAAVVADVEAHHAHLGSTLVKEKHSLSLSLSIGGRRNPGIWIGKRKRKP